RRPSRPPRRGRFPRHAPGGRRWCGSPSLGPPLFRVPRGVVVPGQASDGVADVFRIPEAETRARHIDLADGRHAVGLEAAEGGHEAETDRLQVIRQIADAAAVEAAAGVGVLERADQALGDAIVLDPAQVLVAGGPLLAVVEQLAAAVEIQAVDAEHILQPQPALPQEGAVLGAQRRAGIVGGADADAVGRQAADVGVLELGEGLERLAGHPQAQLELVAYETVVVILGEWFSLDQGIAEPVGEFATGTVECFQSDLGVRRPGPFGGRSAGRLGLSVRSPGGLGQSQQGTEQGGADALGPAVDGAGRYGRCRGLVRIRLSLFVSPGILCFTRVFPISRRSSPGATLRVAPGDSKTAVYHGAVPEPAAGYTNARTCQRNSSSASSMRATSTIRWFLAIAVLRSD
ncbi:hypothetical protein, partial [Plasmodium yoelii yoelii]